MLISPVFFLPKRISRIALLGVAAVFLTSSSGVAQESDLDTPMFGPGVNPIVTLNFASANRLKDRAEFMFEAAGTPDTLEQIMETLEENVNGLEGINWDRPAGLMVYLNSVLPPSVEVVAYLPISDEASFQSMMELGPVIMQKDTTEEGRYELVSPRRNTPVRIEGNYAFLQLPMTNPDPAFDRELPPPTQLVAGLSSQFDVSLAFNVDAVPKPTRDLLYNMLTSFMSTQHQQRDDEPDAVYAVRDAWQQRDIAAIKMLFQDAKRLAIGMGISEEERTAHIDLVLEARNASDLLEEMFLSISKPSYFGALADEDAPVSVVYSSQMAERDSTALADMFEAAKGWLAYQIEEKGLGQIPQEGSPLFQALTALANTSREGHVDVFAQLYRDSSDKMAVIGAMRLEDGEAVGAGLQDVLERLQGMDGLGEMEIGAAQHAAITFHTIGFENAPSEAVDLFGKDPGVTFGVGARSGWFVVGGEDSFDVLKGVIDQLEASYNNPSATSLAASNRVVLNIGRIREFFNGSGGSKAKPDDVDEVAKASGGDEKKEAVAGRDRGRNSGRGGRGSEFRRRREAANAIFLEALEEGQDRIEIDVRPTQQGVRTRATMHEGFIRAIGRYITSMMSN